MEEENCLIGQLVTEGDYGSKVIDWSIGDWNGKREVNDCSPNSIPN